MKRWKSLSSVFFIACCVMPLLAAQVGATEIAMEHHGWGRFLPGAWRLARITTVNLDEQGNVISTTVTDEHTELLGIQSNFVKLRVESEVEVAGKRFEAPIQTVSQGYHGEAAGERVAVLEVGEERAVVDGRTIPCRVRQYTIADGGQERRVKVHYTPDVAPYVIRRETVTSGPNQQTALRADVEVVALEKPQQVFDEILTTSEVKTVIRNGKGSRVMLAAHAENVPGEVVSYTSQEYDSEGRLIRRSTMTLVDYGYSDPEPVSNFRGRRLNRRARRASRR
jgi:hypothetical protein